MSRIISHALAGKVIDSSEQVQFVDIITSAQGRVEFTVLLQRTKENEVRYPMQVISVFASMSRSQRLTRRAFDALCDLVMTVLHKSGPDSDFESAKEIWEITSTPFNGVDGSYNLRVSGSNCGPPSA